MLSESAAFDCVVAPYSDCENDFTVFLWEKLRYLSIFHSQNRRQYISKSRYKIRFIQEAIQWAESLSERLAIAREALETEV